MSGPNLAHSRDLGIDLIGPLPEVVTPPELLPDGITQAQFRNRSEKKISTCPQGYQAQRPSLTENAWSFHFPQKVCAACPLHARCRARPRWKNRGHEYPLCSRTIGACPTKNRGFEKGLSPTSQWRGSQLIGVGAGPWNPDSADTSDRRNATYKPSSPVVLLT